MRCGGGGGMRPSLLPAPPSRHSGPPAGGSTRASRSGSAGAPRRPRGESPRPSREREIASLVVAGHPTRAIAETLVISERTVETHIAAIYRKLGVSSRRALETLLA